MSCSNKITPILSKDNLTSNCSSSFQSYNDLINYCSIRKQLIRNIPQYMNYPNQKFNSNRIFVSDIEEFQKLKQEIISMKESIALLKEKKEQKLEQIEQLRCLMRKVGNKQNNNNHNYNYTLSNKYHTNRETKFNNNNDQRFRCNNKQQQQCDTCIKSTTEEAEGGLSGIHTTSGMSSGKDDDSAPKGDDYADNEGEGVQGDFINNNSSNSNSSNNQETWHCCFILEDNNKGKLLLEKEN